MTPTSRPVVSLAMYPFGPLRAATEELWATIRAHLGAGPSSLEWTVVPPEVWFHPDLLLAQACGWPLVTSLADRLTVVGTFDYAVPNADRGTYCSVIIGRDETPLATLQAMPGVTAAVNGTDSLSGWVSLQSVWLGVPPLVVETGAHLESVRSVAQGRADVASIDAVSWAHFCRLEPALVAGLHVLGAGPRVPCLPLVVPEQHAGLVPALRAACAAAVADPAAAGACSALLIRGFVPLDFADYAPLRTLLG